MVGFILVAASITIFPPRSVFFLGGCSRFLFLHSTFLPNSLTSERAGFILVKFNLAGHCLGAVKTQTQSLSGTLLRKPGEGVGAVCTFTARSLSPSLPPSLPLPWLVIKLRTACMPGKSSITGLYFLRKKEIYPRGHGEEFSAPLPTP